MEWKTTQESCKENSTGRLSQKHLCEQEQEQEAFVQEVQRSRKIVGKLIKFPSRKTIQNRDIVESLHIEIENCEQLLKEALEHLEYLNEEIAMLTEEHTQLLNELIEITEKEEQ